MNSCLISSLGSYLNSAWSPAWSLDKKYTLLESIQSIRVKPGFNLVHTGSTLIWLNSTRSHVNGIQSIRKEIPTCYSKQCYSNIVLIVACTKLKKGEEERELNKISRGMNEWRSERIYKQDINWVSWLNCLFDTNLRTGCRF